MFCEHCGSKLEENTKFCTNCGKCTTEEERPSAKAKNLAMSDWSRELHQEYFWEYFGKGLLGFGIGAVLAIADGFPAGILYLGLAFAGVPYGWNLITRITGGWTLYGIVVIILYYLLKLFFSLLIGITVYPPLLFYHLMMAQKPKSTAQQICLVIFILSIFASALVISGLITK